MKPIQVMFDERLLQRLDEDEEVRQKGRSAVLRHMVADYLRRKRRKQISEAYATAYADEHGLGEAWEGWAEEGAWPER